MPRALAAALAALAIAAPTLPAQVGHRPDGSPYRDIRAGSGFVVEVGRFGGNAGRVGVGPGSGPMATVRFDLRTNKFFELGLGLSQAYVSRRVLDPFQPIGQEDRGRIDQTLTMLEGVTQFNLTGGKTWHRLAPYTGLAFGAVRSARQPADTSGYNFGTKFTFTPHFGVRLFLTSRLHLRTEARATFWRLTYPASFINGTAANGIPLIPDGQRSEWVPNGALMLGLGYTVTF